MAKHAIFNGKICMNNIYILRGKLPDEGTIEYREMMNYESGKADIDASTWFPSQSIAESWLKVNKAYEPASMPGFEIAIKISDIQNALYGTVLDVGAGICWLTARLSQIETVKEVWAHDLSERFLKSIGVSVLKHLFANFKKIGFSVSDYNYLPFENKYFDCIIMMASFHHSNYPEKTLHELNRCLKDEGVILIFEHPVSVYLINSHRKYYSKLSRECGVTERRYTFNEHMKIFKNAGFNHIKTYPLAALCKNRFKKMIRLLLRITHLEYYIIPPDVVFLLKKQ